MELLALAALGLSATVYLAMGVRSFLRARTLRDQLPVSREGEARVAGATEFSAATIAATISLATVILAFAELAPVFGPWLLWTAVTTAAGLVVMRLAAPWIWRRLTSFGERRPTLHGFLGATFASPTLARTAAFCTAIGFMGALAIELTVGSRFLAGLAPSLPAPLAVIVLASVGILYTLLGGFRVVIQTDRVQMVAIWVAIAALALLVWMRTEAGGGPQSVIAAAPAGLFDFGWREGLAAFLAGIFVINVPTFLADMSVWQRIAGTREEAGLKTGLARSVAGAAVSWSVLAVLACFVVALAPSVGGVNSIAVFLTQTAGSMTPVVGVAIFLVVAGLYAAGLSTASTQRIAAGQTLHVDLLRGGRTDEAFVSSAGELRTSRLLVLLLGLGSLVLVEGLRAAGFSISDLVFSIYGAQLGMVPAVLLALVGNAERNRGRGRWIAVAVVSGFVVGWTTAGYGKLIGDGNLVFLAPVTSLAVSSVICGLAVLLARGRR